jgi:hypothetical protein
MPPQHTYLAVKFPSNLGAGKFKRRKIKNPSLGKRRIGCGWWLDNHDVDGAELAGILGIGFSVVRHFLALEKCFMTGTLDSGKMDENVLRSVVVGYESKTFSFVEPFDSTVLHNIPPDYRLSRCKKNSHRNVSQKWKLTHVL